MTIVVMLGDRELIRTKGDSSKVQELAGVVKTTAIINIGYTTIIRVTDQERQTVA